VELGLFIKHRVSELKLDQRELAGAAQVTESYISQLLTGRKAPPAPERTDVYDKLEALLKLPSGHLAKLAQAQRDDIERKQRVDPPAPLFQEIREIILGRCEPRTEPVMRAMFEREAFGPIERLVTQTLLDVIKRVTREELDDEDWLRRVATLASRTYEETRVRVLEFLETEIFALSVAQCETFLSPLLHSWSMNLVSFAIEIVLNRGLAPGLPRRFEFVERHASPDDDAEPGLRAFLDDPRLSATVTPQELAFLSSLTFTGRRPTPLYYYRELQNLRDPLHFAPERAELR
jgi:transcriptional regulator with XRE-family HTH domain